MSAWEAIIGLEIHVQLRTRSKLFCACEAAFGGVPNSRTCPVCLGHPGALPAPNRQAIRLGMRLGLALGARARTVSRWSRKHYFYPDLPKGYQITQHEEPLCEGGSLSFGGPDGEREVRLRRVHLEEDAGRLRHPGEGGPPVSLVDCNRCGIPLAEIVTEPELRSAAEARACVASVRRLVRWIDVCDGNMEEGSLRCDANLSVRRRGEDRRGERTELKNLNSLRALELALENETRRQIAVRERGARVVRATFLWDADRGVVVAMRTKEDTADYRFLEEPDLAPLEIDPAWAESVRADLPDLPGERRRRFVAQYGLTEADSEALVASRELADFFEGVARVAPDPVEAARWVRGELMGHWNRLGVEPAGSPVSTVQVGRLLQWLGNGRLSGPMAKSALETMVATGDDADAVVGRAGAVESDTTTLAAWADAAVEAHADALASWRRGKDGILRFFVGEVMRRSGGRADPERALEQVRAALERRREG